MSYLDTIQNAIDSSSEDLTQLSQKIWENPEMGWTEYSAVKWTTEVLEKYGFSVEVGAYGMPTAIRAVWGQGKPVVGFAAEYDCLPGLSQEVCSTKKPIIQDGIGHGCGHNLLGVGCLGACIGLKAALEENKQTGTIIFYGCPAEEQLTGKGFMAKNGAFQECDFTYAWHPATINQDTMGNHTGVEGFYVHFKGKTAHAAAAPHLGRSALDAAQLMNLGVEFLREHVTDDVRIHYTFTDGGLAPNIVPGTASLKYFIRALDRKNIIDTVARVKKCAEGAAIMTETTYEIEPIGGLYPTLQNSVLCQAVQDARAIVPLQEYTEEELQFADEINQKFDTYKSGKTQPMNYQDQTLQHFNIYGSTDYGDVQHICPGFQVREATASTLTPGHSWAMTACSGSTIGEKGMIRAAKLMAIASYDIMSHPEKLEAAKEEFKQEMNGSVYECPITDDIPWPYK